MIDNFITHSLKSIVLSSKFFRNRLNLCILFLITFFIKNLTDAVFYTLFKRDNPYIDFIVSVVVTVSLEFVTPYIGIMVRRYKDDLLVFTQYLIEEMTHEKLERIKKVTIFSLSIFAIILLQFVEVTSFYLVHTICCFLTSYIIIDNIKKYQEGKGWIWILRKKLNWAFNRPEITGEELIPCHIRRENSKRRGIKRYVSVDQIKNIRIQEGITFEEEEII